MKTILPPVVDNENMLRAYQTILSTIPLFFLILQDVETRFYSQ